MNRLVGLVLLVAACKPQAPAAAPAAAPDAGRPAARETSGSLPEDLDRERKQRPSGTPAAEAVLDAVEQQGIKLAGRKQYLAATVQASFCMGAHSADDGVNLAVCEYPDEPAAQAGRSFSLEKFAAVKGREIVVNKKTTLTITRTAETPESDVAAQKIVAVFRGL